MGEGKAQGSFRSELTYLQTSVRFDGNEIEMLLTTFGQFTSQKSYVSDRTFYMIFPSFMRVRYSCACFFMIFPVLRSQGCMLEKLGNGFSAASRLRAFATHSSVKENQN